jgi:hypothetical protein
MGFLAVNFKDGIGDDFREFMETQERQRKEDAEYTARLTTKGLTTGIVLTVLVILLSRIVSRRDLILIVGSAILTGMILFPPFSFSTPNGYTSSEGYGFILEPPKKRVGDSSYQMAINTSLLLIQIIVVSIVSGAAYFIAGRKQSPSSTS